MIIPDQATFQKYVKINADLSFEAIETAERVAYNKYIAPLFSDGLITTIQSYSSAPTTTPQGKSYELLMGAICRFTLLEYIPTGELQIGDGGITRVDNENVKTAYANQIKKLERSLDNNAYMEIDSLLELLITTSPVFLGWTSSPSYTLVQGLIIKSSKEFNDYQRLHRPSTTFIHLIPEIQLQQDLYLAAAIPESVLTPIYQLTGLSTIQVELKVILSKALVKFTMASALENGLLKVTKDGARIFEEDNTTSDSIETKPDLSSASALIRKYQNIANIYIDKALKFIIANPSEFGTLPTTTVTTGKHSNIFRT